MSRIVLVVALFGLLALPAQAADVMAGKLKISVAWARATPKGAKVGGGYLTIANSGDDADRLIGGASAVAKGVQVHEMSMTDGVMKMRPVTGGLEIKPGATVTLAPGGYHIMFVGLAQPLKQGEHFKVTLEFAKAGKVDVDFATEGIGATHGGGDNMGGMDHGDMKMK